MDYKIGKFTISSVEGLYYICRPDLDTNTAAFFLWWNKFFDRAIAFVHLLNENAQDLFHATNL